MLQPVVMLKGYQTHSAILFGAVTHDLFPAKLAHFLAFFVRPASSSSRPWTGLGFHYYTFVVVSSRREKWTLHYSIYELISLTYSTIVMIFDLCKAWVLSLMPLQVTNKPTPMQVREKAMHEFGDAPDFPIHDIFIFKILQILLL